MLNSANYARDPEVINIGEQIQSEFDLKKPGVKIYYHQTKGACTHMPDGAMIRFAGGQFATDNAEIKTFLDKIADKPGTQIYTKKDTVLRNVQELAMVAEDATKPAGDAMVALNSAPSQEMVIATVNGMKTNNTVPSESEQALAAAELRNQGVSVADVTPKVPQVPVRK